ncbi:glycosyltransferase family 4 protein [Anditalea andensis]|uniref:Glycosyl transferase family 4 n=1 Tax=Anditalea andensis TaxID=1048983 RepID=A0A074KUJ7_9BACT|nr:glycosyltransferase family 4 protein [Anditalea andensis]KEO73621.1 glycosyl transferase family 4 [Anditalea andensis]
MRIIYIHQYFVTPVQGGAVRSYYLAKGMVEAGMEVDMITAHNEDVYDLKIIEGIKVHYLPVAYDTTFGFFKRGKSFLHFVSHVKMLIPKLPRPELLYISSTPLTTGIIGLWAKRKYDLPYIFEVRDLWPEAPVQMGAVRNALLKTTLYRLENRIYKNALKIVALSPGIKNYIEKKTSKEKVFLIPNFADTAFFKPIQRTSAEKFTISYAGAIGQVNALEGLLELAQLAKQKGRDWQFVMMGKGALLPKLTKMAVDMGLDNLKFEPFGSKEKVRVLLQNSDMVYISFAHLPVLKSNSPNKFFDALAMGKPLIVNHKGWVQELIHTHQLGIYYNAKQADTSWNRLCFFVDNPQKLAESGKRARQLGENYFSSEIAVKQVLHVLDPQKHPYKIIDGVYILTA